MGLLSSPSGMGCLPHAATLGLPLWFTSSFIFWKAMESPPDMSNLPISAQISPVSGLFPHTPCPKESTGHKAPVVAQAAQSESVWPESTLCSTGRICYQMRHVSSAARALPSHAGQGCAVD